MSDANSPEKQVAPSVGGVSGRITEVGRVSGTNEVAIEIKSGQVVTIRGLSDTVTKQFAINLYKYVSVEFEVQNDG